LLRNLFRVLKRTLALLRLHLLAWRAGARLPPGPPLAMLERELADRNFLLQRARQSGPLFKLWHANRLWICVVGFGPARRLLQQQSHCLRAAGIDLTPLFPGGHLKQSKEHTSYRKQLVQAIAELQLPRSELEACAAQELEQYLDQSPSAATWTRTLSRISTAMLMRILLGLSPTDPEFEAIRQAYDRLGPEGLVWRVGPAQQAPFQELRERIGPLPGRLLPGSEALLANLVYLIEMGRWDLTALLQWASRFLGENPGLLERLERQPELAPALLKESLRMAQGLSLMRRVEQSFVFDGCFFPRGAQLRICLWEMHNQQEEFPNPFHFDPERFLGRENPTFAPFGLDHYRCPFGSTSLQLAECFLWALARNFQLRPLPTRASGSRQLHWYPDPPVSVALERRSRELSLGKLGDFP